MQPRHEDRSCNTSQVHLGVSRRSPVRLVGTWTGNRWIIWRVALGKQLVKHAIIVGVSIGAVTYVSANVVPACTCTCRDHQTTGAQPGAVDQFQQP